MSIFASVMQSLFFFKVEVGKLKFFEIRFSWNLESIQSPKIGSVDTLNLSPLRLNACKKPFFSSSRDFNVRNVN